MLKIHKKSHDVPGRSAISNCGYYTKNISAFSDFHLSKKLDNRKEKYVSNDILCDLAEVLFNFKIIFSN